MYVSSACPANNTVPVVVHEVGPRPGAFLDYFDQVSSRADEHGLQFRFFDGKMRRLDVDVLHVRDHLLERALGAGKVSPAQRVEALMKFLDQLRDRRIGLVQTMTQPQATAVDDYARLAQHEIANATSAWIVFDESTPTPDSNRTVVIPLAHYRHRFLGFPRHPIIRGRLLFTVTPQSSAAAARLLGVTRATRTPGLSMRLVGHASSALISNTRKSAFESCEEASFRFERISDGALVQEVSAAELVVQPHLVSFEDWQTVILALSLDRPVLVPDTEATRHLVHEVGSEWVHLTQPPITAAAVDGAIDVLRASELTNGPHMERRDPAKIGDAYAQLFRGAASARIRQKVVTL